MTLLMSALAVLVLGPILTALALIVACRVHDHRARRREIAERLLLLAGTETDPEPHPYRAGRDLLHDALNDPESTP